MKTTDRPCTQEEIKLLSKGLKYNLHYIQKNWLKNINIRSGNSNEKLDVIEQQYFRYAVTKKLKRLTRRTTRQYKK
jgi:hypothetical protein